MKRFLTLLVAASCCLTAFAQKGPIVIDVWPDGAPNDSGLTGPEQPLENGRVANITRATLTVYPAAKPNGIAVIMCPGGGYRRLAMNHEGYDMAPWFNNLGITYAVLKYRMPNGQIEVPLSDGLRSIEILRERASEWGIDPHKVGIMGASAGGNLATQVSTHFTSASDRPDFQVLFYATCRVGSNPTLMLGEKPSQARIDQYTSVKQVNAQTPPAFIMCSADDTSVPCVNSIDYFLALRENGVGATLHIYPSGGHGWGFQDSFAYKREWTGELERWLNQNFAR
ncbi:MAG: alpha/beta hydrolase [Bacteroidales bacterium]|nr:alpha/beta hydrolase [Bacteroidales bacterium]